MKKSSIVAFSVISVVTLGVVLWFARSRYEKVVQPQWPPVATEQKVAQQTADDINGTDESADPESDGDSRSVSSPKEELAPNIIKEKKEGDFVVGEDGTKYPIRQYKTLALPNDPGADQWWVDPTGAEAAWDFGYGEYRPTLAIIDTGFALAHEEFANRLHTNNAEVGSTSSENSSQLNCTDQQLPLDKSCNLIDDDFDGIVDNESGPTTFEHDTKLNCTDQQLPLDKSCNLVDDDGNGLVDDARGFDFVNFDRSVQAGETNPNGTGTTHGTAVAGIAAATGNNGKGIAGADWHSTILPIQALDDDEYGNTISVGRAIRYAADQGADVINLSLGSVGSDGFVREAVAYAISKGSIVVAASGNDGCECILYPARYEEVIAVGASNQSDVPTSFSSFGATLDVLAPGSNMTSAYWSPSNQTSAYAGNLAGTSFAAPFVAGTLSAMKSHMPNASQLQLAGLLTERTNRLSLASSSNRSKTLGYGRVAFNSMAERVESPLAPRMRYTFSVSPGNKIGNYEMVGTTSVYQCETARPGSTTIYKLTKDGQAVYSMSHIERYRAITAGYASATFGTNFCTSLPIDTPKQVRAFSIAREFEDRSPDKY